jgi:hypothetical protein
MRRLRLLAGWLLVVLAAWPQRSVAQVTFRGDSLQRRASNSHQFVVNVGAALVGRTVVVTREYKVQPGLDFDTAGVVLVPNSVSLVVPAGTDSLVFGTLSDASGWWRYRVRLDSASAPVLDQLLVKAGAVSVGTSVSTPARNATDVVPRIGLTGGGVGGLRIRLAQCVPSCRPSVDTSSIGDTERWSLPAIAFPTGGLQTLTITGTDADGLADTVVHTFLTVAPNLPTVFIRSPATLEPGPGVDSVAILVGDSLNFNAQLNLGDGVPVTRGWTGLTPPSTADSAGFRRFASAGRYIVAFGVTDDFGFTVSDTVIVNVRPAPFLTVVTPVPAAPIPRRQQVAGRGAPGLTVRLGCARCSVNGTTRLVGTDSLWSFGLVEWTSRLADTLRLRAGNTLGDSAFVTLPVTFLANQLPVAVITSPSADTGVLVGDSVLVAGTVSDADGTVVSRLWNVSDGRSATTDVLGRLAFATPGVVTLTFQGTDDEGAISAVVQRTITVRPRPFVLVSTPTNGASVAARTLVAGRALPGALVRLRCARCASNDSTRTAAADSTWSFGTVAFASSGIDTLTLVASSAPSDTAVTRIAVTVRPLALATIDAPSNGATVPIRTTVRGRALPGAIVRVRCARCAANDSLRTAAADSTWNYGAVLWSAAGADTVSVTAVSAAGLDTARAQVAITVQANQPPVVTITEPGRDTIVSIGDSLRLAATASDADGTVQIVNWTLSDGRTFTGLTPGVVRFSAAGTVTVSARATDDLGLQSAAATRTIQVLNPNLPPTIAITAPAPGTSFAVGDSVRFTASVADPDGNTPLVTVWRFAPGDSAIGTPGTTKVFLRAGPATVTATVRDARGGTASASVSIVISGRGPNVDRSSPGSATRVDGHDVIFVLRRLGTADVAADVNGDGTVDAADLALVRSAFGRRVP